MVDQINLVCCIVDYHKGSHVIGVGTSVGIKSTTIVLGKGTIGNKFLSALGLDEIRKEICIAIVDSEKENEYYEALDRKLKLNRHNHGIAFSMNIDTMNLHHKKQEGGNTGTMKAIIAIVENGKSDLVIDSSRKQGAKGGTIINGRGSTEDKQASLFGVTIEPEKEVVLILAPSEKVDAMVSQIHQDLNMQEAGNGIVFSLDVHKTMGLFEG